MKKILCVFIFLCASLSAFTQSFKDDEETKQILIPKQVYVGDSARLQYSFSTPKDIFFDAMPAFRNVQDITLDFSSPVFDCIKNDCTILNAALVRSGINYTITVSFVPWKTGKITFPQFDLADVIPIFSKSNSSESSRGIFKVEFAPIFIDSLAEKMNASSLRSPSSPVTLPGTNYVLWTIIISFVLAAFLIAFFLAKLPRIIRKIKLFKKKVLFLRNSILTRLHLIFLARAHKAGDPEFATAWQRIMRSYLSIRFGTDFFPVSSSKIKDRLFSFAGQTMNAKQKKSAEVLSAFFVRTDYIKFAHDSIDSRLLPAEEHEAVFSKNERNRLIKRTSIAIQTLESGDVKK
ncbi:MAG: hypothetical protein J5780_02790 [Treponema sp.]|nr:hypothetical protein [Treponema sp.]